MIRLPTANPAGGFFGTVAAARGAEAAEQAWMLASAEIHVFLKAQPRALRDLQLPDPEHIRDFLDSRFGERMASDVLNKKPVRAQLEFRPARFLKHYDQITRNRNHG